MVTYAPVLFAHIQKHSRSTIAPRTSTEDHDTAETHKGVGDGDIPAGVELPEEVRDRSSSGSVGRSGCVNLRAL